MFTKQSTPRTTKYQQGTSWLEFFECSGGWYVKRLAIIVVVHIVAILALYWLGLALSDKIESYGKTYSGVVTIFSVAIGLYSTVLNWLYHRSPAFHFFVNQLLLLVGRNHTYWRPHMVFHLGTKRSPAPLDDVWKVVSSGRHGHVVKRDDTLNTFSVSLDQLIVIKFRLAEDALFVSFDQKLLVPSQLYDSYREKLARLAEEIGRAISPTGVQCSITIEFAEGKTNPYYGFFVNSISPSLLEGFQVTFRFDPTSDCRIEATRDRVNVEGTVFTEVFNAASQVLAMRALPVGDAR